MSWLHVVVDVPAEQRSRSAEFWAAVLGWPAGSPWPGHPEMCSFEPPDGDAYVHLQVVHGPPRVHLNVEVEDVQASTTRAVGLGATLLGASDPWPTLLSPGGLPFCLVKAVPRQAPGPVAWPGGHRSRMVQICIDSPRDRHDAEVAFWRALLGGRFVPSGAAEFAGKWHDDEGCPVQLLFQRLGESTGRVRAHLDHGTDDLEAEVRRLIALGAVDVGPGRGGWHVLRDPADVAFCVTANSPEHTRRREID